MTKRPFPGPVARPQEVAVEARLGRARLRTPVVTPGDHRRHRHQDALGAAARLQAEQRAAVVHEVELDVAAAPVGLEVALALAVRGVAAAPDDRQVRRQEGVADRAHQREARVEAALGEVVEEDAADAARLVAVLEEEVLVAPALEARIQVGAERRERVAVDGVEVARVLLEAVVRRQVHAAAEPDDRRGVLRHRREHAHVHVHGRDVRVARMEDERDAHRLERRAGELGGAVLRRRDRQRRALDVREAAAAALEQRAAFDQARNAVALEPAADRPLPGVAHGTRRRPPPRARRRCGPAGRGGIRERRPGRSTSYCAAGRCHAGTVRPENEIAATLRKRAAGRPGSNRRAP
jgi:hypothetical protein